MTVLARDRKEQIRPEKDANHIFTTRTIGALPSYVKSPAQYDASEQPERSQLVSLYLEALVSMGELGEMNQVPPTSLTNTSLSWSNQVFSSRSLVCGSCVALLISAVTSRRRYSTFSSSA